MEIYYLVVLFIFGTIFGSFFNVVGDRIPRGESIIFPSSHCPKCKHNLTPLELIPIFSYLIQGGKCKNCSTKIPVFHPIFELCSGILFALAYYVFKLTPDLILALTFISLLLIIFVSDIEYMIISDEILIFFGITMLIEIFIISTFFGFESRIFAGLTFFKSIFYGIIAFIIMYIIKKLGDIAFKRESMGGGDIKLMFIFGLILGPMAIGSIFIGSFIGLPISLMLYYNIKEREIPFGPYLSCGALILMFFQLNSEAFISLLLSMSY